MASVDVLLKSGLFNYDAVTRECPAGFTKITEGTTAVLEPPPKEKAAASVPQQRQQRRRAAAADDDEDGDSESDPLDDQAVFYNPAQVVNRDLSISAIELLSRIRLTEPRRRGGTKEGITILEALSATGLRAIRYFKEITNVRYIIANDMDADAVDCIVRNCAYNGVPVRYPTLTENLPASAVDVYPAPPPPTQTPSAAVEETGQQPSSASTGGSAAEVGVRSGGAIVPNLDDANDLMFRLAMNSGVHPGQRVCLAATPTALPVEGGDGTAPSAGLRPLLQQELMDVVDLDPYGSASPFLDAAFRCIKEGGLMLVTSTDSAILCGNFADTAHAKYSSMPYKASHCHEAAVRTLLACIERVANKHKKYIVPLLSLHIDFYVRCFLRVYTQPAEVKLSTCKLGYQLQCTNCAAFWLRPMATARQPRPSRQERRRYKRDANERNRRAHEGNGGRGINHNESTTGDGSAAAEVVLPGEKRGRDGEGAKGHEGSGHADAAADGAGAQSTRRTEVFPAAPSRQTNPKVAPLTLRQLPSCGAGDAGGASAGACPVCGGGIVLSGPLYAAPTQNAEFLEQLLAVLQERASEGRLNAEARITGLVRTALEELSDCPLFYLLPDVASYVRVRCPPTPYIVGALARLGYRCSQVHCAAAGLKTDCPPEVLFGVMLQWKAVQDALDLTAGDAKAAVKGGAEDQPSASTAAAAAPRPLLVGPLAEADFTYDKAHDFRGRVLGVAKFVPNAPGWGPRRRHQGAAAVAAEEEEVDA